MKNIILAITGASGAIYGYRILEFLAKNENVQLHLIISHAAQITIKHELDIDIAELKSLAYRSYPVKDISACISSGSYKVHGMIIAPCSIKTMSEIANSMSSNLISRSADVVLKEKKKLLLCIRETPLHSIHLENLKKISDLGAVIFPPVPAFYNKPETMDDIINHTVGRILDQFDVPHNLCESWQGIK
jgi:4-hydroxy-3-polyprenylbenzoate decarboxylase